MTTKLPDISTHFAEWYQEIVHQAQLADHAPVRGCMVIRPYGYAIWENIKGRLGQRIKETGHENAAFPLLIPESFFKKEAEHVEGFAPELAIVTHAGGKKLEEPLVVRPTSETIIHYMYAQWLKSWRDLPIKINQWANVVRWEMRPRPFLRTTEFYWQEGHTVHETFEQANEESLMMLNEYVDLAQNYLAIPVISGIKSEKEKFPGAQTTYTFEGVMQDGKALQMGTSHLLSQNFAKSFNMTFQDRDGNLSHPHLTSWGATTRLIGAVVMVHGDQKGLILPPKIAPIQAVIIPIYKKGEEKEAVLSAAQKIKTALSAHRITIDADEEKTPGAKFYHWEMKGVPLRIEIGPRDIAAQQVVVVDRLGLGKKIVPIASLAQEIPALLDTLQKEMFNRAQQKQKSMWHKSAKLSDFGPQLKEQNGIYQTGWCQRRECEDLLREYQATTRCLIEGKTFDTCFNCDLPSKGDVLVAKAY
jgi:prolyl-tRNA synthetase